MPIFLDEIGNVRELENAIAHGFVLCRTREISRADLPDEVFGQGNGDAVFQYYSPNSTFQIPEATAASCFCRASIFCSSQAS